MTANGWIQILFFFLAILAVTAPLGAFMHRVLEGESHFLRRPLGWLERLVYRVAGVDGREQTWSIYARMPAGLQRLHDARDLRDPAPAAPPALEPAEARPGRGALLVQHRGELHHQHELAGLRGRDHDELLQPDGRPRLAQLHLGRGRHRDRRGPRPRPHAPRRGQGPGHDRQLLGGPDPRHRLHPAPDLPRLRAGVRLAGDDPEPLSLPGGARPSRGPSRRSRSGRWPRRRSSSSSGRTAAASSTRTPPIPSRTRTRSPTSSRCS